MSPRPPFVVSLLLMLALLVPTVQAAPAAPPVRVPANKYPAGPQFTSDRPATRSLPPRWIVQLADPALAQVQASHPALGGLSTRAATGRLDITSLAAQRYRGFLQQQQTSVTAAIRRAFPQAQIQRQYQTVFNGMGVFLPGADAGAVDRLRAMPGVFQVYPDLSYELSSFGGVSQIGADTAWASAGIGGQANAGAGVKIAVIDSGIRTDNPFFDPTGFSYPAGFPKGDPSATTPKVIAARAYFRPDLPPLEGSETPQPGEEDDGHGSHVAGIAAGVNTIATVAGLRQEISGVAPRAYLMNYKVFYANELTNGSAFSIEIIAAIEDAVTDGADIINGSLGGRADVDPASDAQIVALAAAVDAGVTAVFAQGNTGPNPSTAEAPGIADKVITVGATTAGEAVLTGFVDVTGPGNVPEALQGLPYGSAEFGNPLGDGPFGPGPYLPLALTGSSLACDPFPTGALAGQIALIERGQCEFSVKAYNVEQAGAVGAIIYNSEAGGEEVFGLAAGEFADQVTIPVVGVARSTGLNMIDWYNQYDGAAQVQIDPRGRVTAQTPDVLAGFSSRGPTFQGTLKPDVVAPGVNILSAGVGRGAGLERLRGFGVISGTSMATPHVAGAAALLKQLHPDWSPADIKSALMSTADTNVFLDEDGTPAGVLDQGAGRIDLARAVNPGLVFDRPSLSYGRITPSPDQPTQAELTVNARNVSGAAQTYTLSGTPTEGSDFGITVTPATLTVAAGQSARFTVTMQLPAGAPAGNYTGMIELSGAQSLHVPLYAQVQPGERGPKVLLIDNDGSSSLELPDYAGYYGNALGRLRIPFDYLDLDALAGEAQTLPPLAELQRYEIVLWFTGDNFVPNGFFSVPTPLTAADQDNLIAYMQSGGNLIATGQDLTSASGVGDLYLAYLGAAPVQDDVFTNTAVLERKLQGTAFQPWVGNLVLDVSAPAAGTAVGDTTGAGNQGSIDEIYLSGADPRTPDPYTTPIIRAVTDGTFAGGYVGLNRADEPTLEEPVPALPYRSTFLSFGLEGIRGDTGTTSREDFLQALLYWTVDRPTVTLDQPQVTVTDPNEVQSFNAVAESNVPADFVAWRFDFGDGSPIFESTSPSVVYQYKQPGTYNVRVEVVDSWGHHAVSAGGDSPPQPIDPEPITPTARAPRTAPTAGGKPVGLAFAATKQTLQGRFFQYWRSNGGLQVFGMPLTAQAGTPLTQTFERNRFEYRPENAAPYDVLLGRLGVEALAAQGRDWRTFATVDAAPEGCRYFPETRHSLCGSFLQYWSQQGLEFDGKPGSSAAESLALFGLPLSEPQEEVIDGQRVLVQWFERARFEYRPNNPDPFKVQLGRLGAELAGQ